MVIFIDTGHFHFSDYIDITFFFYNIDITIISVFIT